VIRVVQKESGMTHMAHSNSAFSGNEKYEGRTLLEGEGQGVANAGDASGGKERADLEGKGTEPEVIWPERGSRGREGNSDEGPRPSRERGKTSNSFVQNKG